MTLEQIKNDYVRENYLVSHDLDTWSEFQIFFANRHPEWFEQHWEEVMKIYAMECLKLASLNVDYEYTFLYSSERNVGDKVANQITNENNLIQ